MKGRLLSEQVNLLGFTLPPIQVIFLKLRMQHHYFNFLHACHTECCCSAAFSRDDGQKLYDGLSLAIILKTRQS